LWRDAREVGRIQSVDAIMPVSAAEAALRQVVLHDVEEVPEAAEDFDLAVSEHIKRSAKAGSQFLPPTEADSLEARHTVIGRQILFVHPQPEIEGEAAIDGPGILEIKRVVPAADFARGRDQIAHVRRSPQALATGAVGVATGRAVLLHVLGDDALAICDTD